MLKKALQLSVVLFFIGSSSYAQWSGTANETITSGNVGIGTNTPASKLEVNLFNPNVVPQQGLLLRSNTFFTWPNAESSYFLKAEDLGNSNATFVLNGKGYLGIGNATPTFPLTVQSGESIIASFNHNGLGNSAIRVGTNNGFMNLGVGATTKHPYLWSSTNTLFIGDDGNPTVFINGMANGSVGIGTSNTGSYKLAVEGGIAARSVKVTTAAFADYVFEPTYQLRSLASLQQYIDQNKHLPGIQSAATVEKEGGFELGNMNVKLLEKVEELTLYILELNKKLTAQQKEIEQLKSSK
jgi:hypothetical protein